MNNIFVSIIVPVYNVEQYLRESVESIICQINEDWELILVDDGSPDRCPQICDKYAENDSRIKVIHQKNQGVAVARNTGLDVAQGEWIWFADSDDWIEKNAVEVLKNKVQENGDDGIDFVMFGYNRNFDIGNKVVTEFDDINTDKEEFLLRHTCFHNQRILFRRDIINKLRFTTGIRLGEDLEFQYKYEMLCHRPISIQESLYYYRIREGSATHNVAYRRHAVKDLYKVMNNLYDFIIEHNIEQQAWLDKRIEMLMKNLLYSASLVKDLDKKDFQLKIRELIQKYRSIGFKCFNGKKIVLAEWSVRWYFILNKFYLSIKL